MKMMRLKLLVIRYQRHDEAQSEIPKPNATNQIRHALSKSDLIR